MIIRLEEQHELDAQAAEAGTAKLRELEVRLAALQAEAQQREENLNALLVSAQKKAESYRAQCEEVTIKFSRSEEQSEAHRRQAERTALERNQLESKLSEVTTELSRTKALFESAQSSLQKGEEEKQQLIHQATKEREKFEQEIAQLRTSIDQMQQRTTDVSMENGRLHGELTALKGHNQEQAATIQILLNNKEKEG